MATTTDRLVYVNGDIYRIDQHLTGRSYAAHLDGQEDWETGDPLDGATATIEVTSYHGSDHYWPFDGSTLTGRLAA